MNLVGTENVIERRHLSVPLAPQPSNASDSWGQPTSVSATTSQIRIFYPPLAARANAASQTLAEGKRAYEVAAIGSALQETRGNAAKAARKLGISPQSMNYRLRRYHINKDDFVAD
jgi:arginine utilization regulatory protein